MTECCVLGIHFTLEPQYLTRSTSPVHTMEDTSSTTTTEPITRFRMSIQTMFTTISAKWRFMVKSWAKCTEYKTMCVLLYLIHFEFPSTSNACKCLLNLENMYRVLNDICFKFLIDTRTQSILRVRCFVWGLKDIRVSKNKHDYKYISFYTSSNYNKIHEKLSISFTLLRNYIASHVKHH